MLLKHGLESQYELLKGLVLAEVQFCRPFY